jgi:hypothetical protein
LTPQEIRDAVSASPALQAVAAGRDTAALAHAMSAGRTRPTMREIGNGLVLETLGLDAGNVVLDLVHSTESLRHVRPLLDQGRLVASSALVGEWLDGLVASAVITRGQADAVASLGYEPDPVSELDVRRACWSDSGEWML